MSTDNDLSLKHRPFVPFPQPLEPVLLTRRLNRFVVEAHRPMEPGEPLHLHLPNSGRMEELLAPGTSALAVLDGGGERKTAGTLLLVTYNNRWVSVDARMPNRLFERCLEDKYLSPFRGYDAWQAEVNWGQGRIDFQLAASKKDNPIMWVETKSCNLVEAGTALFPDAPTVRGTRHLTELADAVAKGHRAAVVWLVQRDDARRLSPHHRADPTFAQTLREVMDAGVEADAYRCRVTPEGIYVLDDIPVKMHDDNGASH